MPYGIARCDAHGRATRWFIEGNLCACFDRIDHSVLLSILQERFHDNRFLRLIRGLLKAGEQWTFSATYSGIPQGGVISPILRNIVLDRLDTSVETQLIPAYTHGHRQRTNPPYVALTKQACAARKQGNWHRTRMLRQQAQRLPSRDPNDPHFRRLWYVRYADDMLLGLTETKREAAAIKHALATFLRHELPVELNDEKTLVTHARDGHATFLGYEVHVLHENSKHDHRRQHGFSHPLGNDAWRLAAGNPWSCAVAATSASNMVDTMDQASDVLVTGEPREPETLTRGSERSRWKSTH